MDFNFTVEFMDNYSSQDRYLTVNLPAEDMLISPEKINRTDSSSVCYLAVFRSPIIEEMILGTVFLNHVYTVFDLSKDVPRIGLGTRSP